MKFTLPFIAALAAPVLAQSPTSPPFTPPWATSDIGKWSSVYNSLVSDGKIPSTLTAAPWPTGSWGPGSGPWGGPDGPGGPGGPGNHGPGGNGGGPGRWGGKDGPGPWGSSNWGPYSDWSTRSEWRSGPWTAWWGGSACPASDWPGWTAGPWGTSAPWTTWSGCTASTTATSVLTTTVSGSARTTTAFGLQVAAAEATGSVVQGGSTGGSAAKTAGVGAAIGAAVLGIAVGL